MGLTLPDDFGPARYIDFPRMPKAAWKLFMDAIDPHPHLWLTLADYGATARGSGFFSKASLKAAGAIDRDAIKAAFAEKEPAA